MRPRPPIAAARGFSLAEVLITVAVIAILGSIAISTYTRTLESSRAALASNMLETVNGAVHRFNEGNYELTLAAVAGSTTDEMTILRALQYRHPVYPKPGSPYMRVDWNPATSSASTDHRLAWTGTLFKLLAPGTSGSGLKVAFDASDLGTPYQFPSGYALP